MKKKILIIPAAAYKEINEQFIPDIFLLNTFGRMKLINNMLGLPLKEFDNIYITINKRIEELYHVTDIIRSQLNDIDIADRTEIVVIDKTQNVVETIIKTLELKTHGDFGLFIKDADATFDITELNNENTVYTYLLEDVTEINPSSKSYVSTTSDDVILNIIEKRVISSEFCAGGYYFNSSKNFIELAHNVSEYDKLYLSNVIYYDILRNNETYRAEQVLLFNE